MGIIFVAFLLLLLISAFGAGKENPDYLSRDMTTTINGYFLTTVFMTHFIQYLSSDMYHWFDWQYIYINRGMGQLIVALFLFYSGYGVMESMKRKEGYIRTFPVKRIFLTALDFEIAAILYLGVSCGMNNAPTVKYAIRAFFAWESLGNSNWYVFAIMYLYIVTFLAFFFAKPKHYPLSIAFVFLFTVIYMFFMEKHKGGWWYDTAICYVAGMLFSYHVEKIRNHISRILNKKLYFADLFILISAFIFVYQFRKGNVWWFEILSVLFSLIVIMLTVKFKCTSPIYSYVGKNLFCFYIYQRIPMILFKDSLGSYNIYLYFFVCLVCTILISVVMIHFYSWLHKKIPYIVK